MKSRLNDINKKAYLDFYKSESLLTYNLADFHLSESGNHTLSFSFWKGIRIATERVNKFDFESCIIPEIEKLFRSLDIRLAPHLIIYKAKNKLSKNLVNLKNPKIFD